MEDFLRKIKLIDDMSTRVHATRSEFVSVMQNHVEESDINGVFSGFFEAFSSNKKEYKGLIDSREFYIRKKTKFFQKRNGSIHAKGIFKTEGDVLIINTKISPFSTNKLISSSIFFVLYITFFVYYFDGEYFLQEGFSDLPIPFILFFTGLPFFLYFSLKREVANMKNDMNKMFLSITSKINHSR